MIVKNEEALLERALRSVVGADAYHILDTGSQDKTIQIAESLGAVVHKDFVWTDSFCDSQNFLLNKLRNLYDEPSWIISLDADECLLSTMDEVKEAISRAKDVVRVTMVAEGNGMDEFGFGRIFRNSPDIFWVSSIHKHLNIPGEGEPVGDIRIMYGYSPAHENDKDRSLRMLEAAVERGEGLPRNMYYLGREYWYKERYQDCVDTFQKYVKIWVRTDELADAYLIMAQAYEKMGKAEEMGQACLQAILVNSNFKEALMYMVDISFPENKSQWQRMARSANNQNVMFKRTETEPVMDMIFLAPHNDDEALFGAYTLLREKSLVIVVTDSFIQPERGDVGCDAETRRKETIEAMKIAGCPVVFLGIKDTELTEEILRDRLKGLNPQKVYAPAIQGGNLQHDIVGKVAKELFEGRVEHYTTYTKTQLHTTGTREIKPTEKEEILKMSMLQCYKSQIALPSTKPHFEAVIGKSEWLLELKQPIKKLLIVPYFGDFPEWMPQFIKDFHETMRPQGYEILFDSGIDGFKERVKNKLGIDYPGLPGTGKVWDYRCAFGVLYEEELKGYQYWGHVDLDVVFGNINKFLPDAELERLDVFSSHNEYVCGFFSLYKNSSEVNNLFKQFPNWKEMMIHPEPNGWVEQMFSRILEQSGLKYAYTFWQGNPWTTFPQLKKQGLTLLQFLPKGWEEIAYFHFRHSKKWPL